MRKGMFLGECATEGCERKARYMPWPEAKVLGNDASFRCPQCCNAIHEYALIVQQNSDKAPKWENTMEALHKTLNQPYNSINENQQYQPPKKYNNPEGK